MSNGYRIWCLLIGALKLSHCRIINMIHPLLHLLCCTAIGSGPQSILILGALPETIEQIGSVISSILQISTDSDHIEQVQLGTSLTEDDLWGRYAPARDNDDRRISALWNPGLL